MQLRNEVHVVAHEWRWVIVVSSGLALLAFIPFLVMFLQFDERQQFMGMIGVNYKDGASYLSKMYQGQEGNWGIQFLHTPEPHSPAFIQTLYPAIGQLARLTGISTVGLFHLMRVCASFFMYVSIYYLGATIWMRLRSRRIFFVIATLGAGFGWLLVPLTGDSNYPDIAIPEAFPFLSSFVNVHFPLTFAFLALLASILIIALRPGNEQNPNLSNGGVQAVTLVVALGVLYPQVLVPFITGMGLYVLMSWIRVRKMAFHAILWLILLAIPSALMFLYYYTITFSSPVLTEWNSQNITPISPPWVMLLGYGLPLALATPALVRAVRQFEADGDQFMILWFVAMVFLMYLPFNIQRRFAAGGMLIVAYFATRAIEDYWLNYFIKRQFRTFTYILGIAVMSLSPVFVMVMSALNSGGLLPRDYMLAFTWVREHTAPRTVVLAAPDVSIWVPGWSGMQVVYAHPYETLDASVKSAVVHAWFTDPNADCDGVLQGDYHFQDLTYTVGYVIVGTKERELGTDLNRVESPCLEGLTEVARFNSVSVYTP